MSSGWLPAPRSAIVTPFTCAPGLRSLIGILTSGVQVYAASTYFCPPSVYGTNVRTGACVSYRPCDACQICSWVPLAAVLNGYGMERRADDHSSFDIPATSRLPFTKAMSVMVVVLGFCRALGSDAGASARLTDAWPTLSSESGVTLPDGSTRTTSAVASGPRPRDAETYTFLEMGFTARSFTMI